MELCGLGAVVEIEDSLPTEKVWTILLDKIQRPDKYLPVTDVVARPSDDGKGTYREMTIKMPSADGFEVRRIIENIYADESTHEIQFVVTNVDKIHINKIISTSEGKRTLEFYLRKKDSEERVFWDVPKNVAIGGINTVLQKAREL